MDTHRLQSLGNFSGNSTATLPILNHNEGNSNFVLGSLFTAFILFFFTVSFSVWGLYSAYKKTDRYTANASMIVSPPKDLKNQNGSVMDASLFYGTELALIQNTQVIKRAKRKLKEEGLREENVTLSVQQTPNTSILKLTAVSSSSSYSGKFLSAVMNEYITLKRNLRAESGEEQSADILRQVDRLRDDLDKVEMDIIDFQKSNNLSDEVQREKLELLKGKQARTRELYNILLKRLQEIDVSTSLSQDVIQIIEPATVQVSPTTDRYREITKMSLLGLVLGMMTCAALWLLRALLRLNQ